MTQCQGPHTQIGKLLVFTYNWQENVAKILSVPRPLSTKLLVDVTIYQRWSSQGRPWPRGCPQRHILESLASKVKSLALASKPQVLEGISESLRKGKNRERNCSSQNQCDFLPKIR